MNRINASITAHHLLTSPHSVVKLPMYVHQVLGLPTQQNDNVAKHYSTHFIRQTGMVRTEKLNTD
jgi:hypothetical protein